MKISYLSITALIALLFCIFPIRRKIRRNNFRAMKDEAKETDVHERVTILLIKEKRTVSETENILFEEGIDSETARTVIGEIIDRIKTLKSERARISIRRGLVFIVLGLIFYVMRLKGGRSYGGGADYIGLIAISYGIYKIVDGYHIKSRIKRDDFSKITDGIKIC